MYFKIIIILMITHLSHGKDYYELLGVKKNADQRDIRRAFKKLAVTQHPDKNKDDSDAHEKFIKLTTAYEILKDPELRKKYDLYGEEGLDNSNKGRAYHSWHYYHDNFGIYDDDPEIVTLNRNDYFDNVINSNKIWLVNFYSPMCSHCHHLAPAWRKIAKELEGVIRIGAVNCEDDWQLCHQNGIQAYPTILHYPKNSQHGIRYTGTKSYDTILSFVLDRLDVDIREISDLQKLMLLAQELDKPVLVFICGNDRECFTPNDQRKVAAIFDKLINIKILHCKKHTCDNTLSKETFAVYLPIRKDDSWAPVYYDTKESFKDFVQVLSEQLPEPQEISIEEYEIIKKNLQNGITDIGWLICFYMGHATELNMILKQLPGTISSIHLGKINCGRYSSLCNDLNINRYPTWGVLKSSGAFEINHGKNTINDIAKFAENGIKAKNLWALSADKVLSIMRKNDGEVWFLDWYAPWCPPCIQFLSELRKASLEFDASVVRFGTIDCTVHSAVCRMSNINSYPTAMLINGSTTHQFTIQKTAANVVHFINEVMNPSVIRLTADNFHHKLGKKKDNVMWLVDFFAPWCGPCQQLAPEWVTVAKTLHILPFVKVGSVDCEAESSLCKSQGIQSYPTIRLYPLGSEGLNTVALYNGIRDSASLLKWATNFLPNKVQELTPSSFQKDVLDSKRIWFVDFFAPWCGHCQRLDPHFSIAAHLMEKKVKFGRINCETYRQFCAQKNVRAYPLCMLYDFKYKKNNNNNIGTEFQVTSAENIQQKLVEYLNTRKKHERDEL